MEKPLVSVIMPMYNVERYVGAAVESVLDQTYVDFELLIVDDCSPDQSIDVVRTFKDARIRIIRHDRNQGLANARNSAINESKGGLLAFLDSDDVMLRDRLARQTTFLHRHPDIALCGSQYRHMSPEGVVDATDHPISIDPDAVNASLAFTNLFLPSTIMMRKEAVPDGGFRNLYAEDYDFLVRTALRNRLGFMREVLVYYRQNPTGTMRTTGIDKKAQDRWTGRSILFDSLGVSALTHYSDSHFSILSKAGNLDVEELKCLHRWFKTLVEANARVRLFEPDAFERAASYVWFSYLYRTSGSGIAAIRLLLSSPLSFRHSQPPITLCKFLVKSLMGRPFASKS